MWTWVSTALAGSVFVNGVNVDGLRSQTFEDCVVTIDSQGNVLITAPGYQIQVADPGSAPPPTVTTPISSVTPPVAQPPSPVPPPAPPSAGVPAGRWWLVSEDNGSQGHTVDVVVNGQTVKTIRSGESQIIFDIGPWLHMGSNSIRMAADSVNAAGGTFYVYVGTGSNAAGTVMLDRPIVQFGLGASRQGAYSREYTLDVVP